MNNKAAVQGAADMPLNGQVGNMGYGTPQGNGYGISAADEGALFEQFMQNAPQEGMNDGSLEALDTENEIRVLMEIGIPEPDRKVFGAGYFTLRTLGVAPLAAYKIIENDLERMKEALLSPPPRAGRVNSKTREPKSFYTPEEVDRLTDEDLNDPKILEDVMKSMTKWNQ